MKEGVSSPLISCDVNSPIMQQLSQVTRRQEGSFSKNLGFELFQEMLGAKVMDWLSVGFLIWARLQLSGSILIKCNFSKFAMAMNTEYLGFLSKKPKPGIPEDSTFGLSIHIGAMLISGELSI